MALLMGALLLVLVLVGPASLTGQPLLIVVGVALGAAILIATRRRLAPRDPSHRQ